MKNNLGLIGSEIINGNNNINSISPLLNPNNGEQKIITKSYNLIYNSDSKDKNSKNNTNNNAEKVMYESKRINSLDLSKIKYNDGYILTDAVNSNPGFGLWAIKGKKREINENNNNNIENNNIKTKIHRTISTNKMQIKQLNEEKNNNYNNNRYKITKTTNNQSKENILNNNKNNIQSVNNSDNSLNLSNNINENNKSSEIDEKNIQNKLLIEQLTSKCNEYEKKYLNIISSYKEKDYLCKNALKVKNEHENELKKNIEEAKLIKEEYKKILTENRKLNNIYKNTKKEVDRLLNVMKSDKDTMDKIREEFEKRLKDEEIERERLNNILEINKKELEILEKGGYDIQEIEKNVKNENIQNFNVENNNIEINNIENNNIQKNNNKIEKVIFNKDNYHKKDYEIENLNEVIFELELKISKLRKKITKTDEENDKLRHILRYKEQKDIIQKNEMDNLYNYLEYQKSEHKNEFKTINQQDEIYNNYKLKNDNIINNKLAKSLSLNRINYKTKLNTDNYEI